jgi:lipid A 4'-phosphatase
MKKAAAIYFCLMALALTLFLGLPQIDLLTSGLFYAPGRGFFLENWLPVKVLYHSIAWLSWSIIFVVGLGAAWLFLNERPLWRLDRKALCFLALSTAVGPGLIVNTVLKDHWGRARPIWIEAFGGTHHFTPAPLPAAECATNCSFASGHAALGYSFVAFAFLLPAGALRRRAITAALLFGTLVGLARIAQGRHFVSDVAYAGLIVYGTTAGLHWWIVEKDSLAAPWLRHLYFAGGRFTMSAWPAARRIWASAVGRLGLGSVAVAILVAISIETVDRPLALFFHAQGPDIHALFDFTGRLGLSAGWLTVFGVGFAALRWGGTLPRLRPLDRWLRACSPITVFLFASIAASGMVADVLKVVFGRARPKLLFGDHLYGFTWFSWHADHWSFPSGHAATIVSLVTAFWYLWPSHVLFYILIGTIVATSRVVIGAHFLSDTMAGAWLALLTTRGIVLLFACNGIDLTAVRHGRPPPDRISPRLRRRFGGVAIVPDRPDFQ